MKKITTQDLTKMINRSLTKVILEKLTVKIGDNIVVKPGLKIKHSESKRLYTVEDIKNIDGLVQLVVSRFDDDAAEKIVMQIPQDDFDQYECA